MATYMLTAIVPIAILGIYSSNLANRSVQEKYVSVSDAYLQQAVESINSTTDRISGVIQANSVNLGISNALYTEYQSYYEIFRVITYEIEPYFGAIKAFNPEINNIYAITDNKMFVDRAPTIIRKDSVSDRIWLKKTMSEFATYWVYDTSLKKDASTGKPYQAILCVRKVLGNVFGNYYNALCIEMKPEALFKVLTVAEPASGFVVMNDANEQVFSIADPSIMLTPQEMSMLCSGNRSWTQIGKDKWYVTKKPIAINGFSLIYFTSQANADANTGRILWLTIILFAMGLIMVLLIIYFSSMVVVRRLNLLEEKAERIAQGDFTVELSSGSSDEIGKLTNIFGKMVASINEMIEKVYISDLKSRESEMKALQAQINPHFLYNVLSLINSMAIKERSYDISRLTTTISSYYRSMLNRGSVVTPIKTEIENLRIYTNIQRTLHNERFDVIFQINEAVYEFNTINIMLQPIVENAIEHGLMALEGKRGIIVITAEIQGSDILFTVKDNGVGLDANTIDEVLEKQTRGYGLNNVLSRIQFLYGKEYSLTISSVKGEWTTVTVRIPCDPTIFPQFR